MQINRKMASPTTSQMAAAAVILIVIVFLVYWFVIRKKAAPPAAPCKVDTDCTSPQVCVSNACSDGPSTPAAPATPTTPTTPATFDNGQACTVGSDCTSGFCVSGVCSATAAPTTLADGQACTGDSDCTGGHCYYGECATSKGSCSSTTPCGDVSTQDCVSGNCLVRPGAYGCTPGCANNFVCQSGKCAQAGYATACDNVTCPTGQICNSGGTCVTTAAVYQCKKNSDCAGPVGPDAVCNSEGYCSCNSGITQYQNSACIGGAVYSTQCSGKDAYSGLNTALDGYTCTGYNYRCAGVVCPYGLSCTDGVCK